MWSPALRLDPLYKPLACPNFLIQISLFQLRPAWIIPFFCYQIFDFALNTLVAVSIVVYPNTIQDYLQQLVRRPWLWFLLVLNQVRVASALITWWHVTLSFTFRHYFSRTCISHLMFGALHRLVAHSVPLMSPSLITSPTRRRLLLSVTCAWCSLCLSSSAVFLASR